MIDNITNEVSLSNVNGRLQSAAACACSCGCYCNCGCFCSPGSQYSERAFGFANVDVDNHSFSSTGIMKSEDF